MPGLNTSRALRNSTSVVDGKGGGLVDLLGAVILQLGLEGYVAKCLVGALLLRCGSFLCRAALAIAHVSRTTSYDGARDGIRPQSWCRKTPHPGPRRLRATP